MNTFISIICESFEAVREELVGKPNDFEVFDWINSKVMKIVVFLRLKKVATKFVAVKAEDEKLEHDRLNKERLKQVNRNMHRVLRQRVDTLINACGAVNLNRVYIYFAQKKRFVA